MTYNSLSVVTATFGVPRPGNPLCPPPLSDQGRQRRLALQLAVQLALRLAPQLALRLALQLAPRGRWAGPRSRGLTCWSRGAVKGCAGRRQLPHGTLFGCRGDARPEVPPAFPVGDVAVLDFPQECPRLDSFGGQQPRGGVGRRRAPGGARSGAESTSRGAHDGSLPRLADASCKRCRAPTRAREVVNARGVPVSILRVHGCARARVHGVRLRRSLRDDRNGHTSGITNDLGPDAVLVASRSGARRMECKGVSSLSGRADRS